MKDTPAVVRETHSKAKSLSTGQIVIYGVPKFANMVMSMTIMVFLAKFYTDTLYLPAGLLAWTFLLARIWDAITDPIVGHISDNTKLKMGRRRPYFLISAIPLSLAYYFLWSPPRGLEDWGLFAYLTVTYLLTYTFWTIFAVPHNSLGAEITMNYHERTRVTGVRETFGYIGAVVAALVMAPAVAIKMFGDLSAGYSNLAICVGAISTVLILLTFFGVKERPTFQRSERVPLKESVRLVFKNHSFRRLVYANVLNQAGGAFLGLLVLYMQDYVIKVHIAQWIILTYLFSALLSVQFWTWLSGRIGKKEALSCSFVLICVVSAASMYYHEGTWLAWYVVSALSGFGSAATLAIAPSMMADVIDQDELESGTRRDGAYFGMLLFVDKAAVGLAGFIGMGALGVFGYDGGLEEQSTTVWWALKIIYSMFPAVFNGLAYFILRKYSIDRQEQERIRAEIEARKAFNSAEIE